MREVEVVPHDESWAGTFASVRDELSRALGPATTAIHHVGSTSVPGLSAKPVIDVLVETPSLDRLDAAADRLTSLGYQARGEYEAGLRVGTAGNASERPMDAMQAALLGGGGCNGDFLRDDAILVVTFLTDDPCYEDSGTAASWYQSVIAAKGGNAEAVVVLGIVPSLVCHYNPDSCDSASDAIGGAHWAEFVSMWGDAGLLGDVCSPDGWPALFSSAVAVIDATCDAFEPPG